MKRTHVPNDDPLGSVDTLLLDTCTVLREERNLELHQNIITLQKKTQALQNALFWAKYKTDRIKSAWYKLIGMFKIEEAQCDGHCPFLCEEGEAFDSSMTVTCERHSAIFEVLSALNLTWMIRDDFEDDWSNWWKFPDNQKIAQIQHCVANDLSLEGPVAITQDDCHLILNLHPRHLKDVVAFGTRLTNANVGYTSSNQDLKYLESLVILVDDDWGMWENERERRKLTLSEIIAEYLKYLEVSRDDLFSRCYSAHLRDYLGWEDIWQLCEHPPSP